MAIYDYIQNNWVIKNVSALCSYVAIYASILLISVNLLRKHVPGYKEQDQSLF